MNIMKGFDVYVGKYPSGCDPCEYLCVDKDRVSFCKKYDSEKRFGIKLDPARVLPSEINGCLYSPKNCPLKRGVDK